jgi:hypothetical protein
VRELLGESLDSLDLLLNRVLGVGYAAGVRHRLPEMGHSSLPVTHRCHRLRVLLCGE